MSAAHRRFSSPLLHVDDFKRSTRPLTAEQFAQAEHGDIMGTLSRRTRITSRCALRTWKTRSGRRKSGGSAGRKTARSATTSGKPIGLVRIRCGLVRRSAENRGLRSASPATHAVIPLSIIGGFLRQNVLGGPDGAVSGPQ